MKTIEGKNSREGSAIYKEQLITIEDLEMFKTNLLEEIRKLFTEKPRLTEKKYLKSSEVKRMLGISSGTLQNLRINGTLSFARIGRLIFYDSENVAKLLESK